jgi:hypothetical protein
MPAGPSPAAGRFVLNLDDQPVLLQSFDGGNIRGEVVTTSMGDQRPATKHISTVAFEPITVGLGMSMGKPMLEWIQSTLDFSAPRKGGSVVTLNASNQAQRYRHFHDALITEITIPALDGSSKDAAFFTIKIQPDRITYAKGDDAVIKPAVNSRQKKWLCSNFRLRLGHLASMRVARIDALTIKQSAGGPGAGLEIPNLKVTFSAVDAGGWEDWFRDFVIDGNNGPRNELDGAIELLDASASGILGSIALSRVGIFSLREEKQDANTDAIARCVAELYVEQMAIDIP